MARRSEKHEAFAEHSEATAAVGQHDLAILGQPSATARLSLHQEVVAETGRPHGSVNTANVLRLLAYQQYRCALTGRKLTPDSASLDHIVPVRDGGLHRIENTQVLHKNVNKAKSTLTNEEFIQLCRDVCSALGAHSTNGGTV
jgi:5-methylcytosine-specific restriction endonuclease McrA